MQRSGFVRGVGGFLLFLGVVGLAAVPMYVFVSNPGFRQDIWLLMLIPAFFMAALGGGLALRYERRELRTRSGGPPDKGGDD